MFDETTVDWFLEGMLQPGKTVFIRVTPLPFVIGREASCHLPLSSKDVSRIHAQIELKDGHLWIKDLNSTNGTFVNRRRLNVAMPENILHENDIIHFGTLEFRLVRKKVSETNAEHIESLTIDHTVVQGKEELPNQFLKFDKEFMEMLHKKNISPYFNPIGKLANQANIAYEVIAKANDKKLPSDEDTLFQVAKQLGSADKLSEIIREVTVERIIKGLHLPNPAEYLFFKVHHDELEIKSFIKSLQKLKPLEEKFKVILAFKEKNIENIGIMKEIKTALETLNMYLAYDQFNASQARLEELSIAAPHYLRFNKEQMLAMIEQANLQKKLKATLRSAKDLGITTIATGLDFADQVSFFRGLGFDWGQGAYFGL